MKISFAKLILLCLVLCFSLSAGGQNVTNQQFIAGTTPVGFETEINAFIKLDRDTFPPPGASLFTGSSTIRMWEDLQAGFPESVVINRGFGGSTMRALNYYRDYIVLPYNPARIIVYEGDNDLVEDFTPEEFIAQCDTFIQAVRSRLPETLIWFIAIKPSVARKELIPRQDSANLLLKKLTRRYARTGFIDIRPLMYNNDGNLRKECFLADSLHLSPACYNEWARLIRKKTGIR